MVDDVVDEYENMKGKAGDLLKQGDDKGKEILDEVKEKAAALADKTKVKADAWKNEDKPALS